MKKIKVLLADDHPVIRTGLRILLNAHPNIEVVGDTPDGTQVISMLQELSPDILVLDIQLLELDGIEVIRKIKENQLPVRILVLSGYDEPSYIQALFFYGAAGYLTKTEAIDTIIEAILGIANGETGWVSRSIAAQMALWLAKPQINPLTVREVEVLEKIVNGLSNAEIGRSLKIKEKTVAKHVSSILSKLGVNSRVEAAVLAVQEDIV